MALRRAKIASVADSAEPAKIQPSDLDIEAIPPIPGECDYRIERTGTSPNRYIRGYVYDLGEWSLVWEIRK